MAKPRTTHWPLDPHTLGKHRVLRAYLNAWFPILGQSGHALLFIDGFSGPGRYVGGEDGSPLIALKAFRDLPSVHRIPGPIRFFFIEADQDRHDALEAELVEISPTLPPQVEVLQANAKFHERRAAALNDVAQHGTREMPIFCMADPFGMTGMPMSLFRRILDRDASELYITVMQSFVDRFAEQPELEPVLEDLFGTPEWRAVAAIPDTFARRRAFLDLYEIQLRRSGAKYVLRFDLFDKGRYVYTIFFATNHIRGCERMKDAIWKVMPDGGFQYRDRDDSQLMLDVLEPRLDLMQEQILQFLHERGEPVLGSHLEHWAQGDGTPFRKSNHLRAALKALKAKGAIVVESGGERKLERHRISLPR